MKKQEEFTPNQDSAIRRYKDALRSMKVIEMSPLEEAMYNLLQSLQTGMYYGKPDKMHINPRDFEGLRKLLGKDDDNDTCK